jgi:hypothetical protein
MSDLNFIIVARLYNVCCKSEVKMTQKKERKFYCKRVLSGDGISFPKREFGKKKVQLHSVIRALPTPQSNWVARFRTGHLSREDEERPGR